MATETCARRLPALSFPYIDQQALVYQAFNHTLTLATLDPGLLECDCDGKLDTFIELSL